MPRAAGGAGGGTLGDRAGCPPGLPGAPGTDPRPGHRGPFIKDASVRVLRFPPPPALPLPRFTASVWSPPALPLPRFTASVWSLPHQAKPLLLKPGPRPARLTSSGSFLGMQALGSPHPRIGSCLFMSSPGESWSAPGGQWNSPATFPRQGPGVAGQIADLSFPCSKPFQDSHSSLKGGRNPLSNTGILKKA